METFGLEIPVDQSEIIAGMGNLEKEEFEKIIEVLRTIPPQMRLRLIATHVRPYVDPKFFRVIVSLFLAYEELEHSIESFVNSVISTISFDVQLDEDSKDILSHRLTILLTTETPLRIAIKSLSLTGQHERVYLKGRIFTDLRPVFHKDMEKEVGNLLIMHSLKIKAKDDEVEQDFFSLTPEGLSDLKTAIMRAEKKEAKLKQTFEKFIQKDEKL